MAEKKYYWLKLNENFMNSKEIKKMRRIAGGDTYVCIYLKMLLISIKSEGKLLYEGIEDNFYDELSLEIDEEPENIKITCMYLQKHKMLEVLNENEFILTYTENNIGSESSVAERVRRHRAKQKALLGNEKTLPSNDKVTRGNTCNTEKIREEKIREDKKEDKENNCIKSDYDIQLKWFDTVWKLYPRKEGKHRIIKSKTKLKELYKDKENVEAATINYAKKVENTEKQFIKKGSTFYNDDYLDFISVQDEKNEYLKNKYGI